MTESLLLSQVYCQVIIEPCDMTAFETRNQGDKGASFGQGETKSFSWAQILGIKYRHRQSIPNIKTLGFNNSSGVVPGGDWYREFHWHFSLVCSGESSRGWSVLSPAV